MVKGQGLSSKFQDLGPEFRAWMPLELSFHVKKSHLYVGSF